MLDAIILQHEYVLRFYSDLECYTRKIMFLTLLNQLKKSFESNKINEFLKQWEVIVDRISCYSIEECGLSQDDKKALKVLFHSLVDYIVLLRIKKVNGFNRN